MQDVFLAEFWQGLTFQFPCIAAYLFGFVMALYYRRRYPGPCWLVLWACGLKLINAVTYPAMAAYLAIQGDFGSLSGVEIAVGIVDALGYGLLFWAVFKGRKSPPPITAWHESWDDDDLPGGRIDEEERL